MAEDALVNVTLRLRVPKDAILPFEKPVVVACGDTNNLGDWDPTRAPKLKPPNLGIGNTENTLMFQGKIRAKVGIMWKYVLLYYDGNGHIRQLDSKWEEDRPNRRFPARDHGEHKFNKVSDFEGPEVRTFVAFPKETVESGPGPTDTWIPWALGSTCGNRVAPRTIFHAFHWQFVEASRRLREIRDYGFDALQISPAQRSKSYNGEWWARYQPQDYGTIEGLGSLADLKQLCDDAKALGMIIVGDVVFNHMLVAGSANEWEAAQHHAGKLDSLQRRLIAEVQVVPPKEKKSTKAAKEAEKAAEAAAEAAAAGAIAAAEAAAAAAAAAEAAAEAAADAAAPPPGPPSPQLLSVEDFQWPWFKLEGDHWDNENRFEGWGNGEWSELRHCPNVVKLHQYHLKLLLDAGVRGIRFDAVKHMRPAHLAEYTRFLENYSEEVYFYGEVLGNEEAMHREYMGPLQMPTTDFAMLTHIQKALLSDKTVYKGKGKGGDGGAKGAGGPGGPGKGGYASPTAASAGKGGGVVEPQPGPSPRPNPIFTECTPDPNAPVLPLSKDSVRFARNHDTVMNDFFCGLTTLDARVVWTWLLTVHDGTVLVYPEDVFAPDSADMVKKALNFRHVCAVGGATHTEVCLRYQQSGAYPMLLIIAVRNASGNLLGICLVNLLKDSNFIVKHIPTQRGIPSNTNFEYEGRVVELRTDGTMGDLDYERLTGIRDAFELRITPLAGVFLIEEEAKKKAEAERQKTKKAEDEYFKKKDARVAEEKKVTDGLMRIAADKEAAAKKARKAAEKAAAEEKARLAAEKEEKSLLEKSLLAAEKDAKEPPKLK